MRNGSMLSILILIMFTGLSGASAASAQEGLAPWASAASVAMDSAVVAGLPDTLPEGISREIVQSNSFETGWYSATPFFMEEAQRFVMENPEPGEPVLPREAPRLGQKETFWATNVESNQFYQVEATLMAIGEHCYIYLEDGQDVSQADIDRLKNEFDTRIYPINTSTFGSAPYPGISFDPRITFLLLDIIDGWEPGKGFVGGYFFPLNQYSRRIFPYSNERSMFYIDVYPNDPASDFTGAIIAHEFQHMIHWNHDPREKIWLNEAMSQYAMYACGYGHAQQTFAFINNPHINLTAWARDVMIENYGAVYLFPYYLVHHYGGETLQEKQAFTLELVASQERCLESIDTLLKARGVQDSIEKIVARFQAACVLNDPRPENGLYAFDDTIDMRVRHRRLVSALPASPEKDTVLANSAHSIVFTRDYDHLPLYPTLIDSITLITDKPGFVHVGVNDWQTPLPVYLPDTAVQTDDMGVRIPLEGPDMEGRYTVRVGPFRSAEQPVKTLDYVFRSNDGQWSEPRSIPIVDETLSRDGPYYDSLQIHFDGDTAWLFGQHTFKVAVICENTLVPEQAPEIRWLPLNNKNEAVVNINGYGSIWDRVTLLVVNTGGRSRSGYSVSAQGTDSGRSALELAREIVSLRNHADAILERGDDRAYLDMVDRMRPVMELWNAARLREGLDARDPAEMLKELEGMSPELQGSELVVPEERQGDTTHTNILYLLSKKEELIHALTHLKIDPVMLEGEILQALKLLQINLNFPHIPFPDGLALVNYNEDAAKAYCAQLRIEHTEHDKQVLRRLTMAEALVEHGYNHSLQLAEDTSMSLYKTFNLFLSARTSISAVLGAAEEAPIIGRLFRQLKNRLIEKITIAANKVVKFTAQKLPSPYGSIVPFASDIVMKIIFRTQDIESSGSGEGFIKSLAVKTGGKYVMSSVPRIGFVPLTQKSVDLSVELAHKGEITGSIDDAMQAVINDGNPETMSSSAERITDTVQRSQNQVQTNWHVAGISSAVSDITQITSLIDPTGISTVVTIVGKVLAGGFLAHSIYHPASRYYSDLPLEMNRGVMLSYDPFAEPDIHRIEEALETFPMPGLLADELSRGLEDSENNYEKAVKSLVDAVKQRDDRAFARALENVLEADREYEDNLRIIDTLIAGSSMRGRSDDIMEKSRQITLEGAELMGDVFAYIHAPKNQDYADKLVKNADRLLNSVREYRMRFTRALPGLEIAFPLMVFTEINAPSFVKAGEIFRITATLRNLTGAEANGVSIKFAPGYDIEALGKDSLNVGSLKGYSEVPAIFWAKADQDGDPRDMQATIMVRSDNGFAFDEFLMIRRE